MANKDKILLFAMISMLLPGALPDVEAAEGFKKSPKRTDEPARRNGRQPGLSGREADKNMGSGKD